MLLAFLSSFLKWRCNNHSSRAESGTKMKIMLFWLKAHFTFYLVDTSLNLQWEQRKRWSFCLFVWAWLSFILSYWLVLFRLTLSLLLFEFSLVIHNVLLHDMVVPSFFRRSCTGFKFVSFIIPILFVFHKSAYCIVRRNKWHKKSWKITLHKRDGGGGEGI